MKQRHYIMNATASNHWYNFYSNKVNSFVERFGDNFSLVINGANEFEDAYILPFRVFKTFFSPDYLDQHNRWVGTIKENRIRLTAKSKYTKSLSVGEYYNAFTFLDDIDEQEEIVTSDDVPILADEELQLNDLQYLISKFNALYEKVKPQKRISVSERVARPNAITDYLKRIQNYTCQICGVTGFKQRNGSLFIETHHIIALHEMVAGTHCSDNIIVVCPTCHRKLHYANVVYSPLSKRKIRVLINDVTTEFERNVISNKETKD